MQTTKLDYVLQLNISSLSSTYLLTINLWLSCGMCLPDFYLYFQNLKNIPETNINAKIKGTNKETIKESIVNVEQQENKGMQDKAKNVEKTDEAGEIIYKFEYITRSKYRNITRFTYKHNQVFKNFDYLFQYSLFTLLSNTEISAMMLQSFFSIAHWHN